MKRASDNDGVTAAMMMFYTNNKRRFARRFRKRAVVTP